MAFKMKGSPMARNFGAPFKKDKVSGDKHDDAQADKLAQMSYTEQANKEALEGLKSDEAALNAGNFNLSNDVDGKNVEGQISYNDLRDRISKNANIARAYRHQNPS